MLAGAISDASRSWREVPCQAGQGLVEYGLILGLGALLAIAILVFFGGPVAAALDFVGRLVDEATRGA